MSSRELIDALDPLLRLRTDHVGGDEPRAAEHLAERLASFNPDEGAVVEVERGGGGRPSAYAFARWGTPRVLLNAHLDTVPVNAGWTGDPFTPRLVDEGQGARVVGLGACDTKGGAAAILAALARSGKPRGLGILFSGDEEHSGTALRAFLDGPHARGIERAIVVEPTGCRVGARHRGILAVEFALAGRGGHSSQADHMPAPLADLARLATAIADWGRARRDEGPEGFRGLCVNVARLDGGVAFNVVPDSATLCVSVRPPPGADAGAIADELLALGRALVPRAEAHLVLDNPPFLAGDAPAFAPLVGEIARAPIDLPYWTEAALFRRAGVDAIVYGPGHVEQAHAPDEWVAVAELEAARDVFAQAIAGAAALDEAARRIDGSR